MSPGKISRRVAADRLAWINRMLMEIYNRVDRLIEAARKTIQANLPTCEMSSNDQWPYVVRRETWR
jgi:hypothetical protein